MQRFFIKYIPPIRGVESIQYLQDYLYNIQSTVTFSPCFYDNANTFGYLDGEGDELSRVLRWMEGRFSAVRLTPFEFAGAAVYAFCPYSGPEDPPKDSMNLLSAFYIPPEQRVTYSSWLAHMGIVVKDEDQLNLAKLYKAHLMKEIAKKTFYDDNDAIADLAKISMIYNVYKKELTQEELDLLTKYEEIIRKIYTKEVALAGFIDMVEHLTNTLEGYYEAKIALEAAKDIGEVIGITLKPATSKKIDDIISEKLP